MPSESSANSNYASTHHVEENHEAILVAYIPGDVGAAVFDTGLEEAQSRGRKLVLVNAPRAGRTVDRKMIDETAKRVLADKAQARGIDLEIVQPIDDDPVSAIEDLTASGRFSMLVIGLRRRSSVGKFIMGSTAQRLLLGAEIPVLAIKHRKHL